jgi:dihydrofolate reductase
LSVVNPVVDNQEVPVAHVIVQAVASLDGFIARPDDVPGPIFDWYDAGEVEIAPGDPERAFHVSRASADYMSRTWQPASVMVIGRTLFDIVNGWEGRPASGEHVFVVTHREAAQWQREHPDAPYTFVPGVEEAVRRAAEHVGPDGTVGVTAGDIGGQAIRAGLVDELAVDLAPVYLGQGKRFLGDATDELVLDDPHVVIQGERVLHLRYRMRR